MELLELEDLEKIYYYLYIYGGTTYITIPRLTLFGLGFPKWQHSIEHLIWENSSCVFTKCDHCNSKSYRLHCQYDI